MYPCAPWCWLLQEKGFEVVILEPAPTAAILKAALANANQFWITSGCSSMLSDEAIDLIVDEWRSGMGMYDETLGGVGGGNCGVEWEGEKCRGI